MRIFIKFGLVLIFSVSKDICSVQIFINFGSVSIPIFLGSALRFPMPKYGLELLMFKLLLCVLGQKESCASIAKAQEVRSP